MNPCCASPNLHMCVKERSMPFLCRWIKVWRAVSAVDQYGPPAGKTGQLITARRGWWSGKVQQQSREKVIEEVKVETSSEVPSTSVTRLELSSSGLILSRETPQIYTLKVVYRSWGVLLHLCKTKKALKPSRGKSDVDVSWVSRAQDCSLLLISASG